MSRTARASLIAAAAILALGVAVLAATLSMAPSGGPAPSALGGPFRLVDQDGRRVDESLLTGRPTLMFFGFTHCPDVCPTKLFEMAQVMQRLGSAADRVQVVLVSVDPERDTPELLKAYVSGFDARFRGLTGTAEEVAAMARAWRAYYRRVPLDGGQYTVDHTSAVYLVDAQGRFVSTFDVSDPDRAAQALRRII
jgi:protein SCO1/2